MAVIRPDASVSVSELKRNPSAVIAAAGDAPVAVLVHNKPSAYLVPAATYLSMLERLEDVELAELMRSRTKERLAKVVLARKSLAERLAASPKSPIQWQRDAALEEGVVGRELL